MALYSLTQFISVLLLYTVSLGQAPGRSVFMGDTEVELISGPTGPDYGFPAIITLFLPTSEFWSLIPFEMATP